MLVVERSSPVHPSSWQRGLALATTVAALAAAGCSANITRFDNPSFALSDGSGSTAGKRNNGAPVFDDGPAPVAPPPSASTSPSASRPITLSALPQAAPPPPPASEVAPVRTSAPAATANSGNRPVSKGDVVEVQPGDTLYAIARRHHVMISELMAANDLKNPNIKPGQKLNVPAKSASSAAPRAPMQRVAAAPSAPRAAPVAPAAPVASPAEWHGSLQVKPGESLYGIARQYGVKADELQRVNGIADAQKVRPGTMLKVPGEATASAPAAAERPAPIPAATGTGATRTDVKLINGSASAEPEQKVAAVEQTDAPPAAKPATAAASPKLRWPVTGRVVQKFGPRSDGSQNDGIDVAVPMGTEVVAAEAGTVAYAGNEVKAYGNLILVRHDNGWVTAYAYNDQILVQRGDRVRRGQAIAKAGKSGSTDQPQLHFEVRVGAKPVDPMPLMDKM